MIPGMRVVILFLFKNKYLILLFLLFLSFNHFPQRYARGLILETDEERFVVRSPTLISEDYNNLPSHFSLKEFAPEPGNQGPYSTCAAWATTYSARSLSFILNRLIPTSIKHKYYFSPSFVYNQLKKDSLCNSGVSLREALDIIKIKGSIWFDEFDYSCSRKVTAIDLMKAKNFSILDYREIFSKSDNLKILKAKKSISENKPLIIAMSCPTSFESVQDVWIPSPEDYHKNNSGHALVLIGYDDKKYGGSFEVLNSWGTEWADSGFCWIRYSDFDHFVYYGYELIENDNLSYNLPISGTVSIKLLDNNFMEFVSNENIFSSKLIYKPGTQFEIFIKNNTPVFLYCFAIDDLGNFTNIFPKDSLTHNILPYKKSTLPIPDENHYLELDSNGKNDFLFMILSKSSLNINSIIRSVGAKKINYKKIIKLFSSMQVFPPQAICQPDNKIQFVASSIEDRLITLIFKIRKGN